MNTNELFHPNFVAAVEVVLSEKCVNGETVSRKELCFLLDLATDETLTSALENAIGGLVSLGALEGYEVRGGRYGGIGKIGDKRPVPTKVKGERKTRIAKPKTFPEGFVEAVNTHLDQLATDDTAVTRRQVAEAMGTPGSQTEIMISKVYNEGLIEGFVTKIGPQGGFVRVSAVAEEEVPATERNHQPVGTDGDDDMLSA